MVSSVPTTQFLESSHQLVFLAGDIGNVHVVGRWAKFFELLASEDINSDEMDLCVTVFASLGGGHVYDLAGAVLDNDETVLSQGRALHRKCGRGSGICALKRVLVLYRLSVGMSCFEKPSKVTKVKMRLAGGGACAGSRVLDK